MKAHELADINSKINRLNIDNSVIEYDSVLNQILIYLHMWNVNRNNALYKRVRHYAYEAHKRRTS